MRATSASEICISSKSYFFVCFTSNNYLSVTEADEMDYRKRDRDVLQYIRRLVLSRVIHSKVIIIWQSV